MSVLSTGPFPGFFEKIIVYDLPFIFKNEEIAYEVIDGLFGEKILDSLLEETGMRGLAYVKMDSDISLIALDRSIHQMIFKG